MIFFRRKNRKSKKELSPIEPSKIINEGFEIIDANFKKIKKKISWFYKVNFFLATLVTLILFYFIVLVSTEPKSFPYLTNKAQDYLRKNINTTSSIDSAAISFTAYGTIKLSIENLRIQEKSELIENNQFVIPYIETEISLLDIITFNFIPNKIKIKNSQLIFSDTGEKNFDQTQGNIDEKYTDIFKNFFQFIQNKKINIEHFKIENSKIIIRKPDGIDTEILIKESLFKALENRKSKIKYTQITSESSININDSSRDTNINSNCAIINSNFSKCAFEIFNLEIKSLSNFCQQCSQLGNINSLVTGDMTLSINEYKISEASFNLKSNEGSFYLKDFFEEIINFKKLNVSGSYNKSLNILNISNINAIIIDGSENSQFSMSLLLSNINSQINREENYFISIENVSGSNIKKYWPKSLPNQDLRTWVSEHISQGNIDSAFAKFKVINNNNYSSIKSLEANIKFSNITLNYDVNFPQINSANGFARFDEKSMQIDISSGIVLDSKINNANIYIKDFYNPILEIKASTFGSFSDALSHANYKSTKFLDYIKSNFDGNSTNSIEIKIPFFKEISLKNISINIKSLVTDLKNNYVNGKVEADISKNEGSNKFNCNLNMRDSKISFFSILSDYGDEVYLNFSANLADINKTIFENINLTKKFKKNNKISTNSLSAYIAIDNNSGSISLVKIKNNFGKNNYNLSFIQGSKITLSGSLADFSSINQGINKSDNSEIFNENNLSINVNLSKLILANQKSFSGVSVNVECEKKICKSGIIKAFNPKDKSVLLDIHVEKNKDGYSFVGNIFDIGFVSEALDVYDKISQGSIKLRILQSIIDNSVAYKGEINLKSDITIYDDKIAKKLDKNDLLSSIKDSIFSSNKTTFSNLKMKFLYSKNYFQIDSLIANNYKIGITGKGFMNFSNNSFDINGMIVPGFIINNLFGIGNIPLIGTILTGGEGKGLFGISYSYKKDPNQKEATLSTNKMSAIIPSNIKSLF